MMLNNYVVTYKLLFQIHQLKQIEQLLEIPKDNKTLTLLYKDETFNQQ
jgi:hypothetical protein